MSGGWTLPFNVYSGKAWDQHVPSANHTYSTAGFPDEAHVTEQNTLMLLCHVTQHLFHTHAVTASTPHLLTLKELFISTHILGSWPFWPPFISPSLGSCLGSYLSIQLLIFPTPTEPGLFFITLSWQHCHDCFTMVWWRSLHGSGFICLVSLNTFLYLCHSVFLLGAPFVVSVYST